MVDLQVAREGTAFSPLQPYFRQLFKGSDQELAARIAALMERVVPLRQHEEKYPGLEWPPGDFHSLPGNPLPNQIISSLLTLARPKRMLEIGTFIGISACYFAEVLPADATLITLEKYELFADVARRNIERFGWASKVKVICCDAFEQIQQFAGRGQRFDAVFLDGNKDRYDEYFVALDPLLEPGGVLIVDDIFFTGDVLNDHPTTDKARGVRRLLELTEHRTDYHKSLVPVCDGTLVMCKRR